MNGRFTCWCNRVTNDVKSLIGFAISVACFPFFLCKLPFRLIARAGRNDKQFKLTRVKGNSTWAEKLGRSLLPFYLSLRFRLSKVSRTRILVFGASLLALLLTPAFLFYSCHKSEAEHLAVIASADSAFKSGNLEDAVELYEQSASKGLTGQQKLNWAVALLRSVEPEKQEFARQKFDELAPDDSVGFAPAHKLKALELAHLIRSKALMQTKFRPVAIPSWLPRFPPRCISRGRKNTRWFGWMCLRWEKHTVSLCRQECG